MDATGLGRSASLQGYCVYRLGCPAWRAVAVSRILDNAKCLNSLREVVTASADSHHAASEPRSNASREDRQGLHSASSASLPSPPVNADVPKTLPRPEQSLSADTDNVPPRIVLPANISAQVVASKKPRLLLISPEAVAEAAKGALAAEQYGDGFTTQGAVVLDPALREQLNTALRRTGNVGSEGSPEPVFDGAGWTQQVQIGNKCFRVQSANPLDSTSHEAWYPSPIPR